MPILQTGKRAEEAYPKLPTKPATHREQQGSLLGPNPFSSQFTFILQAIHISFLNQHMFILYLFHSWKREKGSFFCVCAQHLCKEDEARSHFLQRSCKLLKIGGCLGPTVSSILTVEAPVGNTMLLVSGKINSARRMSNKHKNVYHSGLGFRFVCVINFYLLALNNCHPKV